MAATTNTADSEPRSTLRTPTYHITSHNPSGRATVHQSIEGTMQPYPGFRTSNSLVYTTSTFPADLNADADLARHQQILSAPENLGLVNPNGTVCRIVDFAPNNKTLMHRTQSLDYGVVLEGEVLMQLDDGSETLMRRGDVAVQRATKHAWKNASESEWARMLFVLQDCMPLSVGGESIGEDLGAGSAVFAKSRNDG